MNGKLIRITITTLVLFWLAVSPFLWQIRQADLAGVDVGVLFSSMWPLHLLGVMALTLLWHVSKRKKPALLALSFISLTVFFIAYLWAPHTFDGVTLNCSLAIFVAYLGWPSKDSA